MRFLGGLYTVRVVNSAYRHNCSTSGYKYGNLYTNNTVWMNNKNSMCPSYVDSNLTIDC